MRCVRQVLKTAAYAVTDRWPAASRLMLLWDIDSWVIRWEMRELLAIARALGLRVLHPRWRGFCRNQAIFYGSQFFMLSDDWLSLSHRVGTAYFHGRPGSGVEEFDALYDRLCRHHERLASLQVSHSEMQDVVLGSGIAPEKVFRIPIGVNPAFFPRQTPESKRAARRKHGIPLSAAVVGSFQKDGVGWGEGREPKRIKGPDVLLDVLARLKERVPELYVLLTAPARGYVKSGLERLAIPYRHLHLESYPEIGEAYQALDLYLVTSRQEGGPKAVLEAMASGVPLVTTRVGQAMDLVRHGRNGYMAPCEDTESLVHWSERALTHPIGLAELLQAACETARENSYAAQIPLWREFFEGFVRKTAGGR